MAILQSAHGTGAYALALVATLILAAHLTPRAWWRRLNARALIIVVAGTWAGGALLLHYLPAPPATPQVSAALSPPAEPAPDLPAQPIAGIAFRVHGDLNLRAGTGIEARRLVVVPAGASVLPTGLRHGDWWQLRATVDGQDYLGWASSLWLRQNDEHGGRRFSGTVALRTNPALPR
jgi:hypothetical protein